MSLAHPLPGFVDGVGRGMDGEESPGKHGGGSHDKFMNHGDDPVDRKAVGPNGTSRPGPGWFWYEAYRQWCAYDQRSDCLLFQSGQRTPRPSHIPASTYTAAMSSAILLQHQTGPGSQYATQPITGANQNIVQREDAASQVKLMLKTGPKTKITGLLLSQRGIPATALIYSADNNAQERAFPTFRKQDKEYFSVGRVFTMLWVEPLGVSNIEEDEPGNGVDKVGESVTCKIRRFVVLCEESSHCSALPIATYGPRGVGDTGIVKSNHTIIYTENRAPMPLWDEVPAHNEPPMQPQSIRVVPDDPSDVLPPASRLNFGNVYTIQHNVKVKPYGNVHSDSMTALKAQFINVWSPSGPQPAHSGGPSATGESRTALRRQVVTQDLSPGARVDRPSGSFPARESGAASGDSARSIDHRTVQSTARESLTAPNYATMSTAGAISDEQMMETMSNVAKYAAAKNIPMPAQLTAAQIRALTRDSGMRSEYLARIRQHIETHLHSRAGRNDRDDDSTDDDSS